MAMNLTAVLRLQDEISRPMKNIRKTMDSLKTATEHAKKTNQQFSQGLSSMKSGAGSATRAVAGLAGGLASAYAAQKLLNATVGEAMRVDYNRVSLQAMFKGDQAAAEELTKFIENKAMSSVMSYQDVLGSTQSFSTLTKNTDQIKEMVGLTERLSYLNPMEGFEGAGFAIKEALGGDLVSIKDRFNLTSDQLAPLKEATSQTEKLAALNKILNDVGITTEYLGTVNDTTYAKWNKLTDTVQAAFRKLGEAALTSVGPMVDKLTAFMESSSFAKFQSEAQTAFAAMFASFGAGVTKLYENRAAIMEFASSALVVLKDVGNAIKNIAVFIVDNWSVIKPTILGVAAAFAAFKIIGTVMALVQGAIKVFGVLSKTFKLAKTAFTVLRLSMLLFPGGWIIAAIGAVVAAGIWLYKNWDTVKAKAGELWTWIKGKWSGIVESTSEAWSSVKKSIGDAMDSAKTKVSDFFSPLLDFISDAKDRWESLTSKITSFSMPKISMPSMPKWAQNLIPGGGSGVDGSAFHGERFVPRDNMIYKLHKGETVLPRAEAEAYRAGKSGGNNINLVFHYNGSAISEQELNRVGDFLLRKIDGAINAGA